jgi:hypothetical protein
MTDEPELEPLPPVFLTPVELAQRWRISTRTLERWRAFGGGPVWIGLGGGIRYPRAGVLSHESRQRGMSARTTHDGGEHDPRARSGEP